MTPKEIVEKILLSRGITDFEKYFDPQSKYLEKSSNLISLENAKLISERLKKSKNILIYSDYDVDGVTSSAIFSSFLNEIGIYHYRVVIPNRFKDGYGLNLKKLLEEYNREPFDMIITFDCGISSLEEVRYLKSEGVFVVITDHHLPFDILPDADVIINPKISSSEDKGDYYLCGCGIAFKLIHLLKTVMKIDLDLKRYLDKVALATVADIVPLVGDNRILVKHGLDQINSEPSPAIKTLMKTAGLNGRVSSYHLGFVLGPRINASGRLEIADKSYHLLMQNDEILAKPYADEIEVLNDARRKECEEIFEEALSLINGGIKGGICLYKSHWNKGVIGIVASRLVERYNVPVILFGTSVDREDDNGVISGSGRSIEGVDLFELLRKIDEKHPSLMNRFGGHTKACGLSINESNFDTFQDVFIDFSSNLTKSLSYKVKYDMELTFANISTELVEYIRKMEPFGYGNETPKFLFKDVEIIDYKLLSEGKHFSLNLFQGKTRLRGIWFNGDETKLSKKIDIIGTPDVNEYNGNKYLQLRISEII